jgi:hypothetical protein
MKYIQKIMMHLEILFILLFPILGIASTIVNEVPPNPPAPAPTQSTSLNITIANPIKGTDGNIMTLIVLFLQKIVFPVGSVLCVLYIIWAGFKYVMAQGNATELKNANESLKYALIGTAILLGSAGIAKVVQTTVERVIQP